jgi:predicted N-acetyltransferase YhbS
LLGPVAVADNARGQGIGGRLVLRALREARHLKHGVVLLVGDAAYYGRFGFSTAKTGALRLPGPFEQERLLGRELQPGVLDGARGLIRATGARLPKGLPDFLTGAACAPAPLALAA